MQQPTEKSLKDLLVSGSSASIQIQPTTTVLVVTSSRTVCSVCLRSVGSPGARSDHSNTKVAVITRSTDSKNDATNYKTAILLTPKVPVYSL